jgi:4-methylaminobutanoate oxidase (formaldehyde-forming)
MVTFGSTSATSTEMRLYTRDLYRRLEAETGQATGFKPIGFIELATDPDRLEEYRRVAAFNRHLGVDVHEISAAEVAALFPLARTDDILAGFYVKEDGRVDPVDVTMALARGARMQGVRLVEGVAVTDVTTRRGAVTGVRTTAGEVEAEVVVNCAGMWARQLGARHGVNIPLQSAEHYYLLTEKVPGLSPSAPVLEDPGSHGYFREEVGGLLIGLFEPVCAPWRVEGVPEDFSFGTLPPDWERMAPYLEKAMQRVPISMESGVKKFFCGPESFTPDLQPIVGEAPELANYFVAAGLNSIGILTGGGIGRVLAHWIANGRADVDVTGFHIDRLHRYQSNPEYRRVRTVESLGMVYQVHYPTRTPETARGARRSPFHDRLAARGAYFRDVSGWEGADWYLPQPVGKRPSGPYRVPPEASCSRLRRSSVGGTPAEYAPAGVAPVVEQLSWGRQNWFPYWEAEHRAAREGVILMDMSFMAKFLVQGKDAGRVLEQVSANRVDGPAELITYTQWLNQAGKLEADLTVTKLDGERYLVVASDTAHRHAETWLRRHIPDDARAFVTDVTSGFAQLNVQGPRSRQLLQSVTSTDLSNQAFPFRAAREIDIGYARVLCIRITYLGELGYELHIPAEQAVHVYDRLAVAGEAAGLRHAGLKALASLRLEKGYRDYGHDIDNTDSVLEAGLGFAVSLEKLGGFLGRDAVVAEKQAGPPRRRLVQILVLDPEPLMFHAEIVRRDGRAVGYLRAASYGFTLGGAVGLAMIEADSPIDQAYLDAGSWQVEIAGRLYPARASLRPLYDPAMERVKA